MQEAAVQQEKNIIHIVQNENADPSSNSSNVIDRDILLHILKTKDDAVERLSNDSLKLQETIRSITEQSNSKDRAIEVEKFPFLKCIIDLTLLSRYVCIYVCAVDSY